MAKSILQLIIPVFLLFVVNVDAQVVFDFEDPSTSLTFQYFGSDLEPNLSEVIANPDQSGINTSANCGKFSKPVGSQTWAGGFSNPAIVFPVDFSSESQVCVKVWFEQAGNLALKLENGTAANWITVVDVTETGTWTEICFDANEASIEDPFEPATGGVYSTIVVFFDFGVSPDAERTYYFDDFTHPGGGSGVSDVTFSVDMNNYDGPAFTTVNVSGEFNSWSGDANPLSDDDGDGIYEGTVTGLAAGNYEYKFTLDNWANQEQFNGTEACTVTDDSGMFTNRIVLISETTSLPTVCWNSCYACGEAVRITIEMGQGDFVPSDEGFYIAGGGNFGNPGDYPLTDDNGDGVHTLTIERPVGFSSFYTFTNGACGDYSCKENIAGQDCADPNNFNDRFMGPITQDTTIATCFGFCTTDTNCDSGTGGAVTFEVDMNEYSGTYTTVYISGQFNNWSGDANPMTDDDGDGIFTTTLDLVLGSYEYKFQVDAWADSEQFTSGDPCTVTDDSGAFVNRFIEVTEDASVCFLWATCTACGTVSVDDVLAQSSGFKVLPTLIESQAVIYFDSRFNENKTVEIIDASGKIVKSYNFDAGVTEQTLELGDLNNGLYFVVVQTTALRATEKIVVNR